MKEGTNFTWDMFPFRIDSYGNWLSFGYPLFGGWLPYLAFDSDEEYIQDGSGNEAKSTIKFIVAEWFIRGYLVIYSKELEYEEGGF